MLYSSELQGLCGALFMPRWAEWCPAVPTDVSQWGPDDICKPVRPLLRAITTVVWELRSDPCFALFTEDDHIWDSVVYNAQYVQTSITDSLRNVSFYIYIQYSIYSTL